MIKAKKFADEITADHHILGDEEASRHGDKVALTMQDKATFWLQSYASRTKSAEDNAKGFQRFLGPQVKPELVYTDGSKEFEKVCSD